MRNAFFRTALVSFSVVLFLLDTAAKAEEVGHEDGDASWEEEWLPVRPGPLSPHSEVVFLETDGSLFSRTGPLDEAAFRKAVRDGVEKDGKAFSVRVFADAAVPYGKFRKGVLDVCAEEGVFGVYADRRGARSRLVRQAADGDGKKLRFSWATDPEPFAKAVCSTWPMPAFEVTAGTILEPVDPDGPDRVDWIPVQLPSPGMVVLSPWHDDSTEECVELEKDPPPESPFSRGSTAVRTTGGVCASQGLSTTVEIGKPLQGSFRFFEFNRKRCTEEMLSGYFGQCAENNSIEVLLFGVADEAPAGLLVRALELAREAGLHYNLVLSIDGPPPSCDKDVVY